MASMTQIINPGQPKKIAVSLSTPQRMHPVLTSKQVGLVTTPSST